MRPENERKTDGPGAVPAAVDALMTAPSRGKDGRFVAGNPVAVDSGVHSQRLAGLLAPATREIAQQALSDVGQDDDAAPMTLRRLAEAFAQTSLLREAVFEQLGRLGGPISAKGKARALLSAYVSLVDRELRLATAIGLERKPKTIRETPLEWLDRVAREREQQAGAEPEATADEAHSEDEI